MLANPLVVKVTNASGTPLVDQVVNFHVTGGSGSVYAGVALTNASGIAQEWWTLGPQAGSNTLEARAVDSGTGERKVFATFTAQAQVPVASVTVTPASPKRIVGGTVQLTVTNKDGSGNVLTGRLVTWTTSNATVATVSANGRVTAKAEGSAVITATCEGVKGTSTITVTAPVASTDTVFYEGFESGTLDEWDDGVNTSMQRVVNDAAIAFAGTRSVEMTVPAGSNGSWLSRFFMPGYDSVFVRFYVKFANDWTGTTYVPTLRGSRTDDQWSGFGNAGTCPTGTNFFDAYLVTQDGSPGHLEFYTYWNGMPREPDGVSCWGRFSSGANTTYASPPAMAKNRWYKVEFWVKLNTPGQSNGIQRFWVDGQQRGEWVGLNFRSSTILRLNSFTLHAFAQATTSAARHLYYDEVLVTTTSPYVNPGQSPPPDPVATVTVAPSSSTVQVGNTVQLTATTKDANGTTLPGRTVIWSTSNATVATVNASGLVTAKAAGTATITATSEGKIGSATVTVQSAPPPPSGGSIGGHEPAGMTHITERSFTTIAEDPDAPKTSWFQDHGYVIDTSQTGEPGSPSRAAKFTFGAGTYGNTASAGNAWCISDALTSSMNQIYVAFTVKISSNFVGNPTGAHKVFILYYPNNDRLGFTFLGAGNQPLRVWMNDIGEITYSNNVSNPEVTRGEWHVFEMLLTLNWGSDTLKWWMDGQLVGNISQGITGQNWFIQFGFDILWGGSGGTIPADQHVWIGHVKVSAKNL